METLLMTAARLQPPSAPLYRDKRPTICNIYSL